MKVLPNMVLLFKKLKRLSFQSTKLKQEYYLYAAYISFFDWHPKIV